MLSKEPQDSGDEINIYKMMTWIQDIENTESGILSVRFETFSI